MVAISHFTKFKRFRDVYEKQIENKNTHLREDNVLTSYKTSVQIDDLENSIAVGWMKDLSTDKITIRKVQQCADDMCKQQIESEKICIIEQPV